MSYSTVEKKLKQIPEAYLDEVSDYIEFLLMIPTMRICLSFLALLRLVWTDLMLKGD